MENLTKIKWWIPFVTGIILTLFAIFIMSRPLESFLGLAIVFGWIIMFSGIMNIIFSVQNKAYISDWIWYLLLGIFEIVLGAVLFLKPNLSVQVLVLFTGFWMVFFGIARVSNAFFLKKLKISYWWIPLISGILIFIFSFLIFVNPLIAVFSVIYLTAVPLLIYGVMAMYFAWKLKKYYD